jgi:hypothetical protein
LPPAPTAQITPRRAARTSSKSSARALSIIPTTAEGDVRTASADHGIASGSTNGTMTGKNSCAPIPGGHHACLPPPRKRALSPGPSSTAPGALAHEGEPLPLFVVAGLCMGAAVRSAALRRGAHRGAARQARPHRRRLSTTPAQPMVDRATHPGVRYLRPPAVEIPVADLHQAQPIGTVARSPPRRTRTTCSRLSTTGSPQPTMSSSPYRFPSRGPRSVRPASRAVRQCSSGH